MERRYFVRMATTGFSGAYLSLVACANQKTTKSPTERSSPMTAVAQQTGSGTTAIRPFPHVNVPESELDDLRRRIKAMRWPTKELVADQSQGVQLATTQALASYWATEYDWRKVEARLNAIPQFVTEIDGQDIHVHPRPLEARKCAAADHHARLARLDHRADESYRSADRSYGARCELHRTRSIS